MPTHRKPEEQHVKKERKERECEVDQSGRYGGEREDGNRDVHFSDYGSVLLDRQKTQYAGSAEQIPRHQPRHDVQPKATLVLLHAKEGGKDQRENGGGKQRA